MAKHKLQPHDRFVRRVFARLEVAAAFFKAYLPPSLRDLVNYQTLQAAKDSFVSDKLRMKSADLLFSAQIQGHDGYLLVLMEHLSKPDPWLSFRMLQYMVAIWDHSLNQDPHLKQLPLVIPFVLYTGPKSFNYTMRFFDLFGDQAENVQALFAGSFPLLDLSQTPEEALAQETLQGPALLAMKRIYQLRDHPELLRGIFEKAAILERLGKTAYAMDIVAYTAEAGRLPERDFWEEEIRAAFGEEFTMNILEEIKQTGREQGRLAGKLEGKLEGKREIILNLLHKGLAVEDVSEWTGLSVSEILELKKSATH